MTRSQCKSYVHCSLCTFVMQDLRGVACCHLLPQHNIRYSVFPTKSMNSQISELSLTSMFLATYRMLEDIGCRLQDSPPRPVPSAKLLTLPSADAAPSVTQPATEASSALHQSGAAGDLRRQDATTSGLQLSVPEGALDSMPVSRTSSSRYCSFTQCNNRFFKLYPNAGRCTLEKSTTSSQADHNCLCLVMTSKHITHPYCGQCQSCC